MKLLVDSFWRATLYCLFPRVLALSVLPVLLLFGLMGALVYFFWQPVIDAMTNWLQTQAGLGWLLDWLEQWGLVRIRAVLAPALVLALSVPLIVIACLVAVAWLVTPAMVHLVAGRRFPSLVRRHGCGFVAGMGWSLWSALLAAGLLLATLPLWLFPPMALIVPVLVWGWLTARVMAFDALADHADPTERQVLLLKHRWPLLTMGLATGLLGAAPALLWASAALFVVMAPVFVPLAIWLYTLTFVFSSLWFVHYCLAALALERERLDGSGAATLWLPGSSEESDRC